MNETAWRVSFQGGVVRGNSHKQGQIEKNRGRGHMHRVGEAQREVGLHR